MTVDYVAKKQDNVVRELIRDYFEDKGIDIDELVQNRRRFLAKVQEGFALV
jgi:hypothetical protein